MILEFFSNLNDSVVLLFIYQDREGDGYQESINSFLILFCRVEVMSEMSECRPSCTPTVRLSDGTGAPWLAELSVGSPGPARSGSGAAVGSQSWGWDSQPADEHLQSCPRRRHPGSCIRVTGGQQQDTD